MNKKALYWVVGIVIVVIVVIALMVSGGKQAGAPSSTISSQTSSSSAQSSSSTPSGTNQSGASAMRHTMHDLIASGATETCTFSIPATATSSSMSGSVYMSSENMRGDFTTTSQAGKVSNSHMIISNGTVYLWSDALGKGIKLPWSIAASSTSMSARAGINVNQPADYSCQNIAPAASEYTLPANISFTDISAYMR
ncbi:MAG: hypothetical protein P4L61_01905 [Candidatus Pacebacteria bacterium]|nr:hypothetical protein [Candidatus Paceibacterota bacterium]